MTPGDRTILDHYHFLWRHGYRAITLPTSTMDIHEMTDWEPVEAAMHDVFHALSDSPD